MFQFFYFSLRIRTSLAKSSLEVTYSFFFSLLDFFFDAVLTTLSIFILAISSFRPSLAFLSSMMSDSQAIFCSSISLSILLYLSSEILAIYCAYLTMSSYFREPFKLQSLVFGILSLFNMRTISSYSETFPSKALIVSFMSSIFFIFLLNLFAKDSFYYLTNMYDSLSRSFIQSFPLFVLDALVTPLFFFSLSVLIVLNLSYWLFFDSLWSFSNSFIKDFLLYSFLLAELISTVQFKKQNIKKRMIGINV